MSNELTPKQKRFCQEYLLDYNAKQAAIRSGYSVSTAQEQSSRLLSYPKVQRELTRMKRLGPILRTEERFLPREKSEPQASRHPNELQGCSRCQDPIIYNNFEGRTIDLL